MAVRALKFPSSYAVAISASQEHVATVGRNVVVASLTQRKRLFSVHPLSHPSEVSFSPDETHLAVKNTLGEIALLRLSDGSTAAKYRPPVREEGPEILFSPLGDLLAHVTWSGILRVHRAVDLVVEQQIHLPGEMLFALSATSDRALWLVGHRRKRPNEDSEHATTLLSFWQWPFGQPLTVHELGQDHIFNAQLSPCGHYIAVARQRLGTQRFELAVLSAEGDELACVPITCGGTGSAIRWSRNSRHLVAVEARGFTVFEAPSLARTMTLEHAYPSDASFFDGDRSLVLGTWEYGVVMQLGDA